MKKSDLQQRLGRLLPPGICFRQQEAPLLAGGLVLAALWSTGILSRYLSARSDLYFSYGPNPRALLPDAVMVPFPQLLGTGLMGFELFALAMVGLGVWHHLYHRRDSMSVYLMKRLPDPWEYRIRCWAVPLMAIAAAAVLAAALVGCYYLIYLTCTPAQCLVS